MPVPMSLRERLVDDSRTTLLVLFVTVGFVLLIACANFANLLLTRAATRHQELAVRAALGANRRQLVGEMLTESVLYSVAGGVVGLLLASWTVDLLLSMKPEDLRRLPEVELDLRFIAFTFGVSLFTGILFGLIPAFQASRAAAIESVQGIGRGLVGSARHRLRDALVVSEIAMAILLSIGAGLLISSLWRLQLVDPATYASAIVVLVGRIALVACYVPASRAANVDPNVALRNE